MNERNCNDQCNVCGIRDAIANLDERLRRVDDPKQAIKMMLQTLVEFYGADKAYIIETDFDVGYGSGTYEWCAEGVEPRKSSIQYLEVDQFPQWKEAFIQKIALVISDTNFVKDISLQEYTFYKKYNVSSIIAIPFSKIHLRGYISVNNPTKHKEDTTLLRLMSHGIVLELNEIQMNKTIQAATRQIPIISPTELYISCFGKLEIYNSRGVLTDEQFSDQMYGLIGCLALMPNHTATVQQIASFLWPDDTCETPARNISRIIYRLRPILSIVEVEDLIVNKANTFSFNSKYQITVDTIIFEKIYDELKNAVSKEKAVLMYKTALRIYRGELLPRFAHEQAVIPYAVYFQNHYLSLQKKVIELSLEHEDYETAQKITINTLQNAPFDSMVNLYMVILILIQSGKPLGRAYYDKVKDLLPPDHDELIRRYFPKW